MGLSVLQLKKLLVVALLAATAFSVGSWPEAHACSPEAPNLDNADSFGTIDRFDEMPLAGVEDFFIVRRETVAVTSPAWGYDIGGVRASIRAWGPGAASLTSRLDSRGGSKDYTPDPNECYFSSYIEPLGSVDFLFVDEREYPLSIDDATEEQLTDLFGQPTEIALDTVAVQQRIDDLQAYAPWYRQRKWAGGYGAVLAGVLLVLSPLIRNIGRSIFRRSVPV